MFSSVMEVFTDDFTETADAGGSPGTSLGLQAARETKKQALAILAKPDWHDFGPTFAAEQLAKHHRILVGKETLRKWMTEAGMWEPGSRRIQAVHGRRPRRSGFGELVQTTGNDRWSVLSWIR
jgi:hypothetical protein